MIDLDALIPNMLTVFDSLKKVDFVSVYLLKIWSRILINIYKQANKQR